MYPIEVKAHTYEFSAGPKFTWRTRTVDPFVFAGVGIAHGNATAEYGSLSESAPSQTGFGFGMGGGLDWNVNKTFAIRAPQVSYSYGSIDGLNSHGVSVGFGVVFRIY